jgi:hypothetical protein
MILPQRLLTLLTIFLVAGCATIANKDIISVPVYTEPPGATLIVAGRTYFSPDVVKVPRGHGDFILTIEKDGFRPERVVFKESIDGFIQYNALNAGVGFGVDFPTGRAYALTPNLVRVTLVKNSD